MKKALTICPSLFSLTLLSQDVKRCYPRELDNIAQ